MKEKFISLQGLKRAVRTLGVDSQVEYKARYKEIPGAPSHPDDFVYADWSGWPDLFGRLRRPLKRKPTHGGCVGGTSPEYRSWKNMLDRCTNPSHVRWEVYGGANPPVLVCDRWRDREKGFLNFRADIGERPAGTTLGRFGDIGNYEPGNCAWQTDKEQKAEMIKKRGNKCNNGHEFTPENTVIRKQRGRSNPFSRRCRICLNQKKLAA